jgi:hypothetical protein
MITVGTRTEGGTTMVEGLLLLILHRRAEMARLLRLGLAGPVAVVLCYEIGDNLVPATTVALVALLVAAAYGAALVLLTSEVALSLARGKALAATRRRASRAGASRRAAAARREPPEPAELKAAS